MRFCHKCCKWCWYTTGVDYERKIDSTRLILLTTKGSRIKVWDDKRRIRKATSPRFRGVTGTSEGPWRLRWLPFQGA